MGKSTISMAIFNSYVNLQRVMTAAENSIKALAEALQRISFEALVGRASPPFLHRNPTPVVLTVGKKGGKHPMIFFGFQMVSTILAVMQDFATNQPHGVVFPYWDFDHEKEAV